MWVSLLWKTTEDETGLPSIITQPPAVSGVNTTDLNSYTIGAASVDTMDFPNVVEVPPTPSASTYEVFYADSLGNNGFHFDYGTGSIPFFTLRASKAIPSGTTIHGLINTIGHASMTITASLGSIVEIDSVPYDGSQYYIHSFTATTSSDVAANQNIVTFTGSSNFTLKEYMAIATSPIQTL